MIGRPKFGSRDATSPPFTLRSLLHSLEIKRYYIRRKENFALSYCALNHFIYQHQEQKSGKGISTKQKTKKIAHISTSTNVDKRKNKLQQTQRINANFDAYTSSMSTAVDLRAFDSSRREKGPRTSCASQELHQPKALCTASVHNQTSEAEVDNLQTTTTTTTKEA